MPDFLTTTFKKGYFKNDNLKTTIGAYTATPDKSKDWSNGFETGLFLRKEFPVGDRTNLSLALSGGYTKTTINSNNSDLGIKTECLVDGITIGGKYAVSDNLAVTSSISGKLQGHDRMLYARHIEEDAFIADNPDDVSNSFGSWQMPGEIISHYGSYYSFYNEIREYNALVDEYNGIAYKNNKKNSAYEVSVSAGIEGTNDNNTVIGGIKGTFTGYYGFGEDKAKGHNFAAEAYGNVDVGYGISLGASVNTNKVVKAGISWTF